jgi:hypothetical protein
MIEFTMVEPGAARTDFSSSITSAPKRMPLGGRESPKD